MAISLGSTAMLRTGCRNLVCLASGVPGTNAIASTHSRPSYRQGLWLQGAINMLFCNGVEWTVLNGLLDTGCVAVALTVRIAALIPCSSKPRRERQ